MGRAGPLGPVRLLPLADSYGEIEPDGPGTSTAIRPPAATERSGMAEPRPPERDAWAVLASVEGMGPATFGSFVRRAGSAVAVLERAFIGVEALRDLPDDPDPTAARRLRLDDPQLMRIVDAARRPEHVLAEIERQGLAVLTLEDADYPPALRATDLAPPVLFVRGETDAIRATPAVAVVGTRHPTEAGRRVAARIAGSIARAGATVVSGLAIGIDGVAHEAALVEGARTVAVLGAGHRHLTPAAHRHLARRIVDAGGAVVSEFGPHSLPTKWSFPRRNRIISGLAGGTVVVEAAIRSGALITAAWALEQGRECFLVPGALDDEAARGCLRFLRDHAGLARIVAGIPELLEDLGLADQAAGPGAVVGLAELGPVPGRIAELVAGGVGSVDELAVSLELPAATVLGALTVLELRGLVVAAVGRYRPAGLLATRSRPHAGSKHAGDARPAAARTCGTASDPTA